MVRRSDRASADTLREPGRSAATSVPEAAAPFALEQACAARRRRAAAAGRAPPRLLLGRRGGWQSRRAPSFATSFKKKRQFVAVSTAHSRLEQWGEQALSVTPPESRPMYWYSDEMKADAASMHLGMVENARRVQIRALAEIAPVIEHLEYWMRLH